MIFANREYPVNLKGTKSFIYPANSLSLGDNLLMTIISQGYFRDNPGEIVSLIPFSHDIVVETKQEKPEKVFLRMDSTCVTNDELARLRKLTQVFEFELHKEAHGLWQQGVYPQLSGIGAQEKTDHEILLGNSKLRSHWCWNLNKDYVVFHIRNIKTIRSKNTDPALARIILHHLTHQYFRELFIVLLGNDDSHNDNRIEYLEYDRVVDFRKLLSLAEIRAVIEYSQLYIGSDSGLAHLAGCCNVPMVCWGFQNEYWFPKIKNIDECCFLTKQESSIDWIMDKIKKRLKNGY